MRMILLFLFFASPAAGWEFQATPLCALTQSAEGREVRVTFDHGSGLYAIRLTRADAWTPAPIFVIRFEGARGLTISTDRHALSDGGRSLTVSDTGFGNVLNGIEFNQTAIAMAGESVVTIPLAGAAPEVQKFRACAAALIG